MKRRMVLKTLVLSIIVLSVLVLSYFIVYKPLNTELKAQTYENYRIISSQKEMQVEQYIERSLEGAASLSSRTMIRNAIQDYHEGLMSFNDLSTYTQSKYEDGVEALDNVNAATRVVDGMIVAHVNGPIQSDVINNANDILEISFFLIEENNETHVHVVSPIMYEDTIIGYDIVSYTMTQLLEDINEGESQLTILNKTVYEALLRDANIITDHEKYSLLVKDTEVICVSDSVLNSDNIHLSVSIPKDVLEEDISKLTTRSLLWTVFLIITSLVLVVLLSAKSASNRLKSAKAKQKHFEEKANKDSLTGAHTRHYFDHWLNYFKTEFNKDARPIAIVMSDVNGFKTFNDTYGHQAGDQALIDITNIFKTSIRNEDVLIRYGGDEFLLIFIDCDASLCKNIMLRINEKINKMYASKKLGLAYGYEITHQVVDIKQAIKIADQKMYEHKHSNNTQARETP